MYLSMCGRVSNTHISLLNLIQVLVNKDSCSFSSFVVVILLETHRALSLVVLLGQYDVVWLLGSWDQVQELPWQHAAAVGLNIIRV